AGRAPEALRAPGRETPERAAVAATEALRLALAELPRLHRGDVGTLRYGTVHRAHFRHALAWRDPGLEPPAIEADGDQSTVSVGRSSLPWNDLFTHGPVWRHVVDLAAPESSLCVVPPGNAGAGPHARDHLARWANHAYVPLYLDWSRIEMARESELRMEPGLVDPTRGGRR
ncbi:MAG: penicillin acylase family protein, partial [Candidatus Eiseniibacteriota bacterium]